MILPLAKILIQVILNAWEQNMEKSISFSVSVDKEIKVIDKKKNREESGKIKKPQTKIYKKFSILSTSLENLTDNLSDRTHKERSCNCKS